MLDLPTRGDASGERVARTFSTIGELVGNFIVAFGEAVGVTASALLQASGTW